MRVSFSFATLLAVAGGASAFQPIATPSRLSTALQQAPNDQSLSRRDWFATTAGAAAVAAGVLSSKPAPAEAVGPIKINLLNPKYVARPCPKDKPIPGEKAMKGMKGLCVTVDVDLEESPKKPLELVGVYGFVTDKETGESVLANNPDLSTDAGQFAMVDAVNPSDKKVQFEFIAAVPREMDTSKFEEGIAPLNFGSLRVISFPGGQQYGAVNPCEMNEFSEECEAWEEENGPYKRGEFMVKSNPRTKGY